ncbi:peptide-N4-asparagine amidase [Terriglobus aquaticus]|uniref:Peptide-N4-asparagine amidase n=1 Tax=Terriglobus aquaticus TaxID=940139 RepID=A0ABW9KIN6_9BACT|nr:peptide-N4-asparagine amidase [Terriglobus aquaticus]
MPSLSRIPARLRSTAVACAFLCGSLASVAQVVPVPSTPVVGSSNPATAEPPVTRPTTTPCTVTLYDNLEFNDYSAKPISFAPPADCKGPWAKVVLSVDFTVTKGRQYDRTASLYLGNANIFYGTTAEPRSTLSPSWHVERDVTDLSAIFQTTQTGQAIVYNIFNSTYNGDIFGTAKLQFYPADALNPAPTVPGAVIPVSGVNSPYELDTTASQLTTSVTAPRNTVKAYLDVIAQSQSADEFWYLCVPNDLANELESCPSTAFRETEITIDGKPAGVAPVYPWIYTGGIDPYLWEPIVGVQTLNFKPYRVDLTPFAGVLSDGQQHTVGVSVYNASSYFLATANLLLYTDPNRRTTGGGLLEDTLDEAPTPQITNNLATDASGLVKGSVTVDSKRNFRIKGYVETSAGRVVTTVQQTVHFNSTQNFAVSNNDQQNAMQTSTVDSKTVRQVGGTREETTKRISFPLILDYSYIVNPDGTSSQTVISNQKDVETETRAVNGLEVYSSGSAEQVHSTDTLSISAANAITAANGSSKASYQSSNSLGECYSRVITAANRVLTSVKDGDGCSTEK